MKLTSRIFSLVCMLVFAIALFSMTVAAAPVTQTAPAKTKTQKHTPSVSTAIAVSDHTMAILVQPVSVLTCKLSSDRPARVYYPAPVDTGIDRERASHGPPITHPPSRTATGFARTSRVLRL